MTERGVFALHTVLYPGRSLALTVFEPRYRRLLEDVTPDGRFVVVAIRRGQEVGGPYDPYRVGVEVSPSDVEPEEGGSSRLEVTADARVRLVRQVAEDPYAVWETEPWPEEPGDAEENVPKALSAWKRFLDAAEMEGDGDLPDDPTALSYTLAQLLPILVPDHQALLEVPGPAERLARVAKAFRMEANLLNALKGRRGT
jgi:Lon protease-like protein